MSVVDSWHQRSTAPGSVSGFAVEKRVGEMPRALVAKLTGLLQPARPLQVFHGLTLCGGFQPKTAFRFWRQDQRVDVLICFNCGENLFAT